MFVRLFALEFILFNGGIKKGGGDGVVRPSDDHDDDDDDVAFFLALDYSCSGCTWILEKVNTNTIN